MPHTNLRTSGLFHLFFTFRKGSFCHTPGDPNPPLSLLAPERTIPNKDWFSENGEVAAKIQTGPKHFHSGSGHCLPHLQGGNPLIPVALSVQAQQSHRPGLANSTLVALQPSWKFKLLAVLAIGCRQIPALSAALVNRSPVSLSLCGVSSS